MEDLKNIIESLLFVAEAPLTVERLKQITTAEAGEIHTVLNALSAEYEQREGGFVLREIAGGFQIRTRPEYSDWIKRLLQPTPPRFSKAAMETLAIIAYKQLIIRSEIEHIRGVDSGGVLRLLLERKLVRILGRKEIPGRPLIYATTKKFLEMFDLKNLKDLPTPKEIEVFGSAPAELDLLPPDADETATDIDTTAADSGETVEETDPIAPDSDAPADGMAPIAADSDSDAAPPGAVAARFRHSG